MEEFLARADPESPLDSQTEAEARIDIDHNHDRCTDDVSFGMDSLFASESTMGDHSRAKSWLELESTTKTARAFNRESRTQGAFESLTLNLSCINDWDT
jgi:hypothetical protein